MAQLYVDLGPISLFKAFTLISDWIEYCVAVISGHQITIMFCTGHNSITIVSCAKFYCNHFIIISMGMRWNFLLVWIVVDTALVRWVPVWSGLPFWEWIQILGDVYIIYCFTLVDPIYTLHYFCPCVGGGGGGGCLNMNMSSYPCSDSHVKNKTVSPLSYL